MVRVFTYVLAGALVFCAMFASQPASAQQLKQLSAGILTPVLPNLPAYVAVKKGFFEQAGVKVELVEFESGAAALRANVARATGTSWGSMEPTISAAARGGGVVTIYTHAPRLEVVMMTTPDVKTVQDLRGKKIAASGPGAFAHVMSLAVLNHAGINPQEVEFVPPGDNEVGGLAAGRFQGAVLHVDEAVYAQRLNPDLNIVARIWEILPKQIWGGWQVHVSDLRANRDVYVAFVEGMIRATRWVMANREEAIELGVEYTDLPRDVVEEAYDILIESDIWAANGGLDLEMVEFTINTAVSTGSISQAQRPRPEDVVDLSVVNEVLDRIGRVEGKL